MTGPEIKELRETAGIDQGEVSEALGIDQSRYAKYENGRRAMPEHYAVAAAQFISETVKARAEAVKDTLGAGFCVETAAP